MPEPEPVESVAESETEVNLVWNAGEPTVAEAVQKLSLICRFPRGLVISTENIDRVDEILAQAPVPEVRLVVATDSEGILGIGDQGFGGSLQATVDEFASRAGVAIALRNGIPDAALSAAEQIHVLQIVREALANVLHHAKARRVEVELSIDTGRAVRVRIDDDGIGMLTVKSSAATVAPGHAAPARSVGVGDGGDRGRHHHGLGIMRDRAATLGGTIVFAERPGGGTRVELVFVAATQFAAR